VRIRSRRTIVARHAHLQSPHPVLPLAAMFGVAMLVVVASATGVAAFSVWNAASAIADNAVVLDGDGAIPPSLGAIEGGANILIAGTDTCEGQDVKLFPRCANHDSPGERNDVTILVHISDDPRRVTVVSFPRDMLVDIPSCLKKNGGEHPGSRSTEINTSYFNGGLGCTVRTVEKLTGEKIQFAAAIRWTGVIRMSDAIGGVDVCVAGDISDGHTGLSLTAGEHTLQGVEALQFLRIRHGIGDGSDLGRISNQQQFMSSMVRKLQSDAVLANPSALLSLATTAMSQVSEGQLVLSSGLAKPASMVQLAMALKSVPHQDIVFVQYPTYYRPGSAGSDVMPVTDAADELFAALRENRPLTLTGEASQGDGVEVIGEPAPTASEAPDAAGTPAPSEPPGAAEEERVELPPVIAGQTADQVTCTQPQD